MGSAIFDPQHALGEFGRERAGAGALLVEAFGAAAFDIAAAGHEIGVAALQQGQHLGQLRLVMLQVGIDHRGIGRARGQNALDAGAGQPAPSDPANAADPADPAAPAPAPRPGAVRGIVIDENDLPGDAGKRRLQPAKQRGDVVPLVEGRDDDRKLRRSNRLRRAFGARSDGFIHAASVYPIAPGEAKAQSERARKSEADESGPERAQKCQRPRTEGARTSGAAELFSGRPSAGAMKHRRRRWRLNRDDRRFRKGHLRLPAGRGLTAAPP